MTSIVPYKIRKATSFLLALIFSCQTLFAQAPLTLAPQNPFRELSFFSGKSALPESIGKVEQVFNGKGPGIILLQDPHGHYEAQENIEKILKLLNEKTGLKKVFIEGGIGKLDPSNLRFFKENSFNLKAARWLAREAEIGGPELFLLESRKKITAFGIEDSFVYASQLETFREIAAAGESARESLNGYLSKLGTTASLVMNPDLYRFFKKWIEYEEEKIDWVYYVSVLREGALKKMAVDLRDPRQQLAWPMLVRLFELKARESVLDLNAASEEEKRLMLWAKREKIRPELLRELKERFEKKGKPKIGLRRVWESFYREARSKGFDFKDYPNLALAEGFRILEEEIESRELFEEIDNLRSGLLNSLIENKNERRFVEMVSRALLMKKLLRLELTPEEYDRLKKGDFEAILKEIPSDIKRISRQAMNFYKTARWRDEIMVEKVLAEIPADSKTPVAVVAGGFHSPGFSARLKEKQMAFAIVSPHLSSPEDSKKYRAAMVGETPRFDFKNFTVRNASWMMSAHNQKMIPLPVLERRRMIEKLLFEEGLKRGATPVRRSASNAQPSTKDVLERASLAQSRQLKADSLETRSELRSQVSEFDEPQMPRDVPRNFPSKLSAEDLRAIQNRALSDALEPLENYFKENVRWNELVSFKVSPGAMIFMAIENFIAAPLVMFAALPPAFGATVAFFSFIPKHLIPEKMWNHLTAVRISNMRIYLAATPQQDSPQGIVVRMEQGRLNRLKLKAVRDMWGFLLNRNEDIRQMAYAGLYDLNLPSEHPVSQVLRQYEYDLTRYGWIITPRTARSELRSPMTKEFADLFAENYPYLSAASLPGAGKGTLLKQFLGELNATLEPDKQYVYLEMGDYFRGVDRIIKDKASPEDIERYTFLVPIVSEKDAARMRAGKLVSNETALRLVNAVLEQHKDAYGIIFDGFPRTPDQLEFLKQNQVFHRGLPVHISLFLTINVSEDIAVERIKERAKKDKAAGKRVRGDDLDPEVIRERVRSATKSTKPLMDLIRKDNPGKTIFLDGQHGVKRVYGDFISALEARLSGRSELRAAEGDKPLAVFVGADIPLTLTNEILQRAPGLRVVGEEREFSVLDYFQVFLAGLPAEQVVETVRTSYRKVVLIFNEAREADPSIQRLQEAFQRVGLEVGEFTFPEQWAARPALSEDTLRALRSQLDEDFAPLDASRSEIRQGFRMGVVSKTQVLDARSELRSAIVKTLMLYESNGIQIRMVQGTEKGMHVPTTMSQFLEVLGAIRAQKEEPKNLFDMGSGQGIFAITLAQLYPNLKIIGVESDETFAMESRLMAARAVREDLIRDGQVEFLQGDFNDPKFSESIRRADSVYYYDFGTKKADALAATLQNSMVPGAKLFTLGSAPRWTLEDPLLASGLFDRLPLENQEDVAVFQRRSELRLTSFKSNTASDSASQPRSELRLTSFKSNTASDSASQPRSELRTDFQSQENLIENIVRDWDFIRKDGAFVFDMQKTLAARKKEATDGMIDLLVWLLAEGQRVVIDSGNAEEEVLDQVVNKLKNILISSGRPELLKGFTVYTNSATTRFDFDAAGGVNRYPDYQRRYRISQEVEDVILRALRSLGEEQFRLAKEDFHRVREFYREEQKKFPAGSQFLVPWLEHQPYEPTVGLTVDIKGRIQAPYMERRGVIDGRPTAIALRGIPPIISRYQIIIEIKKALKKELGSEAAKELTLRTGGETTIDIILGADKSTALENEITQKKLDRRFIYYHGDEMRRRPKVGNDEALYRLGLAMISADPNRPGGLTESEIERTAYVGGEEKGIESYLTALKRAVTDANIGTEVRAVSDSFAGRKPGKIVTDAAFKISVLFENWRRFRFAKQILKSLSEGRALEPVSAKVFLGYMDMLPLEIRNHEGMPLVESYLERVADLPDPKGFMEIQPGLLKSSGRRELDYPGLGLKDVETAHNRMTQADSGAVKLPEIVLTQGLSAQAGMPVYAYDLTQNLGNSFKILGSLNYILEKLEGARREGVEIKRIGTHTTFNHGYAVSLAYKMLVDRGLIDPVKTPLTIGIAKSTPLRNQQLLRQNGAELLIRGTYENAKQEIRKVKQSLGPGMIRVEHFEGVVTGYATAFMKLYDEIEKRVSAGDSDFKGKTVGVFVPLGAGGLAAAAKDLINRVEASKLDVKVKIIGVQTPEIDSVYQSLLRDQIVTREIPAGVRSRGIAVETPDIPLNLANAAIDYVALVNEVQQSIPATRLLSEDLEPVIGDRKYEVTDGGTASAAILYKDYFKEEGIETAISVLSGANEIPEVWQEVLASDGKIQFIPISLRSELRSAGSEDFFDEIRLDQREKLKAVVVELSDKLKSIQRATPPVFASDSVRRFVHAIDAVLIIFFSKLTRGPEEAYFDTPRKKFSNFKDELLVSAEALEALLRAEDLNLFKASPELAKKANGVFISKAVLKVIEQTAAKKEFTDIDREGFRQLREALLKPAEVMDGILRGTNAVEDPSSEARSELRSDMENDFLRQLNPDQLERMREAINQLIEKVKIIDVSTNPPVFKSQHLRDFSHAVPHVLMFLNWRLNLGDGDVPVSRDELEVLGKDFLIGAATIDDLLAATALNHYQISSELTEKSAGYFLSKAFLKAIGRVIEKQEFEEADRKGFEELRQVLINPAETFIEIFREVDTAKESSPETRSELRNISSLKPVKPITAIVVAEDEPDIYQMYKVFFSMLEAPEVRVEIFPDGEAALNFIKENKDEVGLLITDLDMPKLAGDELIKIVRGELNLAIPVAVASNRRLQEADIKTFGSNVVDSGKIMFGHIDQIKILVERSRSINEGESRSELRNIASLRPVKPISTIVVAEDTDIILDTYRELFEFLKVPGVKIEFFPDGEKALRYIETHKEEVGLLITDIVMPEMTGMELITHIRKDLQIQIPVIVASGDDPQEYVNQLEELGGNFAMGGKIRVGDLSAIRTLIEESRKIQEPSAQDEARSELRSIASLQPVKPITTIVIAEDTMALVQAYKNIFSELDIAGVKIEYFPDGAEALEFIEANKEEVGLLITDLSMPNLGGASLIVAVRKRLNLSIPVMVASTNVLSDGNIQDFGGNIVNTGKIQFGDLPAIRDLIDRSRNSPGREESSDARSELRLESDETAFQRVSRLLTPPDMRESEELSESEINTFETGEGGALRFQSKIPSLLRKHEEKLRGLTATQAAKVVKVPSLSMFYYLRKHPETFEHYGLKKKNDIPALLEEHKPAIKGLNIQQAAKVMGVTRSGLSVHLRHHPKDFKRYGIVKGGAPDSASQPKSEIPQGFQKPSVSEAKASDSRSELRTGPATAEDALIRRELSDGARRAFSGTKTPNAAFFTQKRELVLDVTSNPQAPLNFMGSPGISGRMFFLAPDPRTINESWDSYTVTLKESVSEDHALTINPAFKALMDMKGKLGVFHNYLNGYESWDEIWPEAMTRWETLVNQMERSILSPDKNGKTAKDRLTEAEARWGQEQVREFISTMAEFEDLRWNAENALRGLKALILIAEKGQPIEAAEYQPVLDNIRRVLTEKSDLALADLFEEMILEPNVNKEKLNRLYIQLEDAFYNLLTEDITSRMPAALTQQLYYDAIRQYWHGRVEKSAETLPRLQSERGEALKIIKEMTQWVELRLREMEREAAMTDLMRRDAARGVMGQKVADVPIGTSGVLLLGSARRAFIPGAGGMEANGDFAPNYPFHYTKPLVQDGDTAVLLYHSLTGNPNLDQIKNFTKNARAFKRQIPGLAGILLGTVDSSGLLRVFKPKTDWTDTRFGLPEDSLGILAREVSEPLDRAVYGRIFDYMKHDGGKMGQDIKDVGDYRRRKEQAQQWMDWIEALVVKRMGSEKGAMIISNVREEMKERIRFFKSLKLSDPGKAEDQRRRIEGMPVGARNAAASSYNRNVKDFNRELDIMDAQFRPAVQKAFMLTSEFVASIILGEFFDPLSVGNLTTDKPRLIPQPEKTVEEAVVGPSEEEVQKILEERLGQLSKQKLLKQEETVLFDEFAKTWISEFWAKNGKAPNFPQVRNAWQQKQKEIAAAKAEADKQVRAAELARERDQAERAAAREAITEFLWKAVDEHQKQSHLRWLELGDETAVRKAAAAWINEIIIDDYLESPESSHKFPDPAEFRKAVVAQRVENSPEAILARQAGDLQEKIDAEDGADLDVVQALLTQVENLLKQKVTKPQTQALTNAAANLRGRVVEKTRRLILKAIQTVRLSEQILDDETPAILNERAKQMLDFLPETEKAAAREALEDDLKRLQLAMAFSSEYRGLEAFATAAIFDSQDAVSGKLTQGADLRTSLRRAGEAGWAAALDEQRVRVAEAYAMALVATAQAAAKGEEGTEMPKLIAAETMLRQADAVLFGEAITLISETAAGIQTVVAQRMKVSEQTAAQQAAAARAARQKEIETLLANAKADAAAASAILSAPEFKPALTDRIVKEWLEALRDDKELPKTDKLKSFLSSQLKRPATHGVQRQVYDAVLRMAGARSELRLPEKREGSAAVPREQERGGLRSQTAAVSVEEALPWPLRAGSFIYQRTVHERFFKMQGMENLPESGAYLIASNHVSLLDGILVENEFWVQEKRLARFVAYASLLGVFTRFLIAAGAAIVASTPAERERLHQLLGEANLEKIRLDWKNQGLTTFVARSRDIGYSQRFLIWMGGAFRISSALKSKKLPEPLAEDTVIFAARTESLRWYQRFIISLSGAIEVSTSRTKDKMIEALEKEGVVGIFPGGNVKHAVHPLRNWNSAVAEVAVKTGKPIVPMALSGEVPVSWNFRRWRNFIWSRLRGKAPRTNGIHLVSEIGKPIDPAGKTVDQVMEELLGEMAILLEGKTINGFKFHLPARSELRSTPKEVLARRSALLQILNESPLPLTRNQLQERLNQMPEYANVQSRLIMADTTLDPLLKDHPKFNLRAPFDQKALKARRNQMLRLLKKAKNPLTPRQLSEQLNQISGYQEIKLVTVENDVKRDLRIRNHPMLKMIKVERVGGRAGVKARRDQLFQILDESPEPLNREELFKRLNQMPGYEKVKLWNVRGDTDLDAKLKNHPKLLINRKTAAARSELRRFSESEDRLAVPRDQERGELRVAAEMTARILKVGSGLYARMFPRVFASEAPLFNEPDKIALAENYADLLRQGGAAVLPASLLLGLKTKEQRSEFISVFVAGAKDAEISKPVIYFSGTGAAELQKEFFTYPVFKENPRAAGLFRVEAQTETVTASGIKNQPVALSVLIAPEDEMLTHPAFLVDVRDVDKLNAQERAKYLHHLAQLELIAAREIGEQAAKMSFSERARLTADLLGKIGIESSIGPSGLVSPSVTDLLGDSLDQYIKARQLTAQAA